MKDLSHALPADQIAQLESALEAAGAGKVLNPKGLTWFGMLGLLAKGSHTGDLKEMLRHSISAPTSGVPSLWPRTSRIAQRCTCCHIEGLR